MSEGRRGRKAASGSILTPWSQGRTKTGTEGVDDADHGRLVHGIKNAFATCVATVGFSFRRRMLYSYHFSP